MDAKEKKEFICESTKVVEDPVTAIKTFPLGKRHIQVGILFMCMCIIFGMRAHLSVALVAMTDAPKNITTEINLKENVTFMRCKFIKSRNVQVKNLKEDENYTIVSDWLDKSKQGVTISSHNCDEVEEDNENITKYKNTNITSVFRTYNWKKNVQEMISGAFFVGYFVMNVPMGMVSQRFGGKVSLLVALLVNSVVSIIIPWAALMGGWLPVCICRMLQGMTQAGLFPGMHTILGNWVPLSERGRLSTYIYTGSQLGVVAAYQFGGYVSGSLGWPVTFWVFGCLGLICFVVLYFVGAATPAEHPTITEAEKLFITGYEDEESNQSRRNVPWRAIFTSIPVWAVIIAQAGNGFCFVICFTEIPAYMSKILRVDIKSNGLLSSLPFISMYVVGLGMGYASDFLLNRGYMTLINVRRTANTIGLAVTGGLLLSFTYVQTVPVAVVLLVLTFGAHSAVHVGFQINHIDLTPNFAGTVMSLGNMAAGLSGIIAPTIVGSIVKDQTNQSQWQTVFLITAIFMFATNLVFVVFLKADIQPWNDYHINRDDCNYGKISGHDFSTPENKYHAKKEEESKV